MPKFRINLRELTAFDALDLVDELDELGEREAREAREPVERERRGSKAISAQRRQDEKVWGKAIARQLRQHKREKP